MKKLFLIAAALFTAISFNACTDDDHENGGSNGGTRLVSQIIQQNEDGTTVIYKFYYDDQGRVIRIHCDDYATCFSYTEDKVEITMDDEREPIYLATLNEQGYIATLNYPNVYERCVDYFSYDKDGYLSKVWWDNEAYGLQCTWNNGDLINEHHTESSYGTYKYTNYPIKQNIDIFEVTRGYFYDDFSTFIGVTGLVGRKSAHLIKSANIRRSNEIDNELLSYDYELNDNSNPIKITEYSIYGTPAKYETTIYNIFYE